MSVVQIADVVILREDKVLLVQQRKLSAYGLWSLPGGHVEPGETPEQAVTREALEEVGAQLVHLQHLADYPIVNSGKKLLLHTFVAQYDGDIHLNDHELMAYGWFSLESI